MNLKQKILQIKDSKTFSDKRLYLLDSLTTKHGFLFGDNKLYYVVKSQGLESESIKTTYLSLQTNIYLNTIDDSPSFKPDYYDLLIYTGNFEETFFESFIELCIMYTKSMTILTLSDFFYSLLKLFEIPKETSYSNLIGLFGELSLIKYIYDSYNIDMAKYWHNSLGTNDKYDFSLRDFNLEVKTTTKESMIFEIKHSQIFNEKTNYIALIRIQNDNSGLSIADLFDFFKTTDNFATNINFWINLQKEKLKVNPFDFLTIKLSFININFFLNKDLETLENIPDCIEKISYIYNFTGKRRTDILEIVNGIK